MYLLVTVLSGCSIGIFIAEQFVFHILEAFLQTKPFVSECAGSSVRMAGTTGGEWKIFKLEAEEELRVEVIIIFQYWLPL